MSRVDMCALQIFIIIIIIIIIIIYINEVRDSGIQCTIAFIV